MLIFFHLTFAIRALYFTKMWAMLLINWTCISEIICPSLPHPDNGEVMPLGQNKLNDQLVYSCFEGFKIEGTPLLTCIEYGKWDVPSPTCASENKLISEFLFYDLLHSYSIWSCINCSFILQILQNWGKLVLF